MVVVESLLRPVGVPLSPQPQRLHLASQGQFGEEGVNWSGVSVEPGWAGCGKFGRGVGQGKGREYLA